MAWTPLPFGKYKGKSLPQVVFADPDYFFWAVAQPGFFKGMLGREAQLVQARATRIRIPPCAFEDPVAEYLIHQPTRKFGDLSIVPRSRPLHEGGSPAMRRDWIDLSIPRAIAGYDKMGCGLLVAIVKRMLFGEKARLTKARVEAFFDDVKNFAE